MRKHREEWYCIGASDRVRSLYEWVDALMTAVIVLTLALSFFLRVVRVSGTSMQPSLYPGDVVLLTDFAEQPQIGDVIVARRAIAGEPPIIKRVIAVSGQTVNINAANGTVSVNGRVLQERAYLAAGVKTTLQNASVQFPLTVPSGKLFVLGDNRTVSMDSRSSEIGFLDTQEVLGTARVLLLPFSHFGKIKGEA